MGALVWFGIIFTVLVWGTFLLMLMRLSAKDSFGTPIASGEPPIETTSIDNANVSLTEEVRLFV